ncbi:helix-turn-helix transcriptional regulator [Gracilibacillus salinarum]|uniref:AraC family transcriptional regulator n=1 Tax=Gracilibacillus salinarum TaxID=2932255 RepID=A0ABY4GPZ4_9BACI|nr:AraC family transcriptional regulator [Gracilibacillus salinarum]UOQ86471.1 AraC family transcriptional regulator [Gracilibacillus salinarum]
MKSTFELSRINELFPYSFTYKNSKKPQNELPDHMHSFHEIIFVHAGQGLFFIHNTLYKMNKGDVFIIPKDTLHHAKPDKHDLITSSVIFFSSALVHTNAIDESFSYLYLIEKVKKEQNFKIQLTEEEQLILEDHLRNIQQELSSKQIGSIHASLLFTQHILLELTRIKTNQSHDKLEEASMPYDWMQHILVYIEENLNQNISLSSLAKESLVSPAHFSRVFKQLTGMGPTAYINKKRILQSKELLLHTDHTISFIAEKTGFESTPHFYRTFKKYAGMTPSEFRKKQSIN